MFGQIMIIGHHVALNLLISVEACRPVSYTHLDVYKRQRLVEMARDSQPNIKWTRAAKEEIE